ncbi:hypothetical protein Mal64_09270 [Pseudobythopirellula maris]|uniref:Uncharacterized protein n=1 Tax=Pseudobythopirellula maris TaxID=2527991 RepID=A0A5C5ZTW7_9BACT|nr:PEP-CTERM sorting domain-containing protein [Pseudobythopirellula maris]TWT90535.1 hypothetical protein Mal64_09270 [Pseudobythopirellula maris]
MKTQQLFPIALFSALSLVALSAHAGLETSPYLMSEEPTASTGHFEWDEFGGSVFAPFAPDAASTGAGSAALSAADFTAQPMDGPGFALVTSTDNVYAGGTLIDWDLNLSGLDTTEADTTVVLQVAATHGSGGQGGIDPASVLLDGAAPTTFIDRGLAPGVLSNIDEGPGSPNDTFFYWAEWRVAADADYLVEFSHLGTHTSFTQVRVDYFNTDGAYVAATPSQVPEPTALAMIGLGCCGCLAANRSRRQEALRS